MSTTPTTEACKQHTHWCEQKLENTRMILLFCLHKVNNAFLYLCKDELYLEKQLVFSDSLDWFDQVRGDGVSKAMSLLDFLQNKQI